MTNVLTNIVGGAILSVVVIGIQTLAWYFSLLRCKSYQDYRLLQDCTIVFSVIATAFVILMYCLLFLLGRSISIEQFLGGPLLTAWFFLLALAGLRIAARLRGLLV